MLIKKQFILYSVVNGNGKQRPTDQSFGSILSRNYKSFHNTFFVPGSHMTVSRISIFIDRVTKSVASFFLKVHLLTYYLFSGYWHVYFFS